MKNSGDAEESQASELLAKLMHKGEKHNRLSEDEEVVTKDLSSNNSLSQNNSQAPQYHLFGLASTQTESLDDDYNEQLGSQKENIDSPRPSGRSNVHGAQISKAPGHEGGRSSAPFVKQPVVVKVKSGSNPPPCIKANVPPQSAPDFSPPLATQSRSPSVDSFCGPVEDPGGQYIATSRQFNAPLSELANSSEDTSRRDDPEMFVHTFGTSPQRRPVLGKVLVEATPSNSSHSDSRSQTGSQESQREVLPFPQGDEVNSQESDIIEAQLPEDISYEALISTNSSQDNFWNNYDKPTTSEPVLEATQLDYTQPETQSTQVLESDVPEDLGTEVDDVEWNRFIASRSTGKPIEVPKHKRARYLESAREGAARRAEQEDDFLEDPDSHTTSAFNPWSVPSIQYPAGYPSDIGQQAQTQPYVETQLIDETGSHHGPAQASLNVSTDGATQIIHESEPDRLQQNLQSIQYPAGLPSESDTEGPEYQETQPLYPPVPVAASADAAIATSHNLKPQETPDISQEQPDPKRRQLSSRPAPISAPAIIDALDIVPDSEPPATSPPPDTPKVAAPERPNVDAGKAAVDLTAMQVDEPVNPDSEDDDDVPLAALVKSSGRTEGIANPRTDGCTSKTSAALSNIRSIRSAKSKGKQKQRSPPDNDVMLPPLTSAKKKGKRPVNESTEIPSSIPNESVVKVERPNTNGKRKTKVTAAAKASSSKAASSTSAPRRQSGRLSKRPALVEDSDKEDDIKEEHAHLDDDYMDVDDPNAFSRKRKRIPSSTASNKIAKVKSENCFQTPANARTTRSQSTACSSTKVALSDTSVFRVLAMWTNAYWYSGTVSAVQSETYTIDFDDGSRDSSKAGTVRLFQFRPGDEVLVGPLREAAKVVEHRQDGLVVSRRGGNIIQLPFDEFCVSPEEIDRHWNDRRLTADFLASIQDRVSFSEACHRLVNANGFLQHCGVVITTSPNIPSWDAEKARIYDKMVKNGITLIEDWSDALQVKGTFDDPHNPVRWVIEKDEIAWFQDPDEVNSLKRVFLLADAPCQKPKYLMALALGVPCLSLKWLTDDFRGRKLDDWNRYLLPQGFIPRYATDVSQFVDLNWGQNTEQLSRIMDNPVASKLFDGLSILCIGSDFIPKSDPGRKNKQGVNNTLLPRTISNRSEMISSVPLIILAMGARRVEAALSYSAATDAKSATFDFVVYKDRKSPPEKYRSIKHVQWTWVKQCLISGRMLSFED